mmetsp:Transcript_62728/g.72970  ORF Transcript_62728/g.72970 Transcript_62728/m.72970 type:complete len:80 (-) Transcript_62728:742-981(-)
MLHCTTKRPIPTKGSQQAKKMHISIITTHTNNPVHIVTSPNEMLVSRLDAMTRIGASSSNPQAINDNPIRNRSSLVSVT